MNHVAPTSPRSRCQRLLRCIIQGYSLLGFILGLVRAWLSSEASRFMSVTESFNYKK